MKKSNKRNYFKGLFIFILSFPLLLASCRFEVPLKEMAIAKTTITRAIEVKSEKYAQEELKQTKEHMFKCHEYIKDEDADKAKDEADKAAKMAEDAIAKSLPLLAADTLNEAKTARDEAVFVYSEKYSPEELSLANDNLSAGESLNNESKFWDSYLKSKDAIMYAEEAKNKSLSNIPALREMIGRINSETDSLEAERGKEFASDEISQIRALTEGSGTLLDDKKIKDAFPKIEQADELLKTAKLKVLKGIAADQIIVAEELLKKSKDSKYKDSYSTEIDKAAGLIASSKDSFNKESYDESRSKSQEAIDVLNSIFIAMEKNVEEKRIIKEETAITNAEIKEYVVQLNTKKRDCLWRIADYMYNDAKLWPVIYMANRDKIKDPDLIFPGQKFIIPPIPKKDTVRNKETKTDAEIKKEDSSQTEAGTVDGTRANESIAPTAEDSAAVKDEQPKDKIDTDAVPDENIDKKSEGGAGADNNVNPDKSDNTLEPEVDPSDTPTPSDVKVLEEKETPEP